MSTKATRTRTAKPTVHGPLKTEASASAVQERVTQVRRECLENLEYFLENALMIRAKDGQVVKFKLRAAQKRIVAQVQAAIDAKRPIRFIVLKARQIGISTLWTAIVYWLTSLHQNRKAYVVAHEVDAATNLFEMTRVFYDESPSFLKPMRSADSAQRMVFANPSSSGPPGLRSSIHVEHAKNLKAGRSATVHAVHLSEAAFYPDNASTFMLALQNAVPRLQKTVVTIESTANGRSGWFYEQWKKAERGDSAFTPVFIAWHDWEDYTLPFPDERTKQLFIENANTYERHLSEDLNLTWEQINWYRLTLRDNCDGNVEQMKQEYPSSPEEAFVYSGRGIVPPHTIVAYRGACTKGTKNLLEFHGGAPSLSGNMNGNVMVWDKPVPGFEYVIGADVALGLEHGDRSAAAVLCRNNNKVVATYLGNDDPDLFADLLYGLGVLYNSAKLAVENNNHGLTTNQKLLDKHYWNLFYRHMPGGTDSPLSPLQRVGWATNKQTRPMIINNAVAAMRDGTIILPDLRFVAEFEDLVWSDDEIPRPEAAPGRHDDACFATAIAWQVHLMSPAVVEPRVAASAQGADSWLHAAEAKMTGGEREADPELGSET